MRIDIDKHIETVATDYSWQFGIGNDHAFQMHRTDMCEHMRLAQSELGFKYIRFHGIFDDDMLCYQRMSDYKPFAAMPYSNGIKEVNFRQIAHVYDNVLACGLKPFVELSFMPSALASGKKTGIRYLNNITKPKSLDRWAKFIRDFITFLLDYYGIDEVKTWYFEVWNEPDLAIFFKGKQRDYFKLYEVTAKAVKEVCPELRVGGPSSSACRWLSDFMQYCDDNNVPYDFISTHHYPGDAFGNTFSIKDAFKLMSISKNAAKENLPLSETMQKMFFKPEVYKTWRKGVLAEMDMSARNEVGDKPLFVTEWNSMAVFASPAHDEKYSAAFVVKTVLDLNNIMDGYMFWCCSDIYEEQFMLGTPFHGGFGLINNCGIPKPNFWAFKMLSQLYPNRLALPMRTNEKVENACFTDGDNMQVLLYMQDNDYYAKASEQVDLSINGVYSSVTVQRIDEEHCNPKREWVRIGEPSVLKNKEVQYIKEQTQLREESIPFEVLDGQTELSLKLHSNDVVLLTFRQ